MAYSYKIAKGLTIDRGDADAGVTFIAREGSDFQIKAQGEGSVQIGDAGVKMPDIDGTTGQTLQTDGAGNLSFQDQLSFSQLPDTAVTSPTDGHFSIYDAGASKWKNQPITGDVAIDKDGVVTIQANAVENTMLAGNIASTKISELNNFDTGDLSEGSNLYYTDARVRANRLDQMAVPTAAVSLDGQKITNLANGTATNDAINKSQLDGHTHGIDNLTDVDTTTTAPTDGQALTWNNTNSVWEPGVGGASLISSATAPNNPSLGDFWYETTDNILYTRIADQAGTELWVDISTGDTGGTVITPMASAPPNPTVGDHWYDTNDNILFLRIVDGAGTEAWIDISTGDTGGTVITPMASAPVNPTVGDHWYDTNDNILFLRIVDGAGTEVWLDISTGDTGGTTITPMASAPLNPTVGDHWYDTDDNILFLRIVDGAGAEVWLDISTGDTGGTAVTSLTSAPTNPKTGDHWYDTDDNILYLRVADGAGTEVWLDLSTGGGGVNLTATTGAPSGPDVGDFWYDTANNILYVRIIDGANTEVWVDITTGDTGGTSVVSAIVAPLNPEVGNIWYDTDDNILYLRIADGAGTEVWLDLSTGGGGTNIISSITAPPGPDVGDHWYDTDDNILYVRIIDGASSEVWLDVSSSGANNIDDLSDVDTNTAAPSDGQVLIWDNTNNIWEPGTVSSSNWTASPEAASLDGTVALKKQTSAPGATADYAKLYTADVLTRPDPVHLLLHFNSDSSSAPIDASPSSLVSTYLDGASLSTSSGSSPSHFPEQSGCYFDGSVDGSGNNTSIVEVAYPSSNVLDGEFTLDFWVKFDDLTSPFSGGGKLSIIGEKGWGQRINELSVTMSRQTGSPYSYILYANVSGPNASINPIVGNRFWFTNGVSSGGTVLAINTWYHIAITRDELNSFKIFVNGEMTNPYSSGNADHKFDWNGTLTLGSYPEISSGQSFEGYIDEFRIVRGKKLWTSDFSNTFASSPPDPHNETGSLFPQLLTKNTEGDIFNLSAIGISDLVDVDLTTAPSIQNQVLTWNTTKYKWETGGPINDVWVSSPEDASLDGVAAFKAQVDSSTSTDFYSKLYSKTSGALGTGTITIDSNSTDLVGDTIVIVTPSNTITATASNSTSGEGTNTCTFWVHPFGTDQTASTNHGLGKALIDHPDLTVTVNGSVVTITMNEYATGTSITYNDNNSSGGEITVSYTDGIVGITNLFAKDSAGLETQLTTGSGGVVLSELDVSGEISARELVFPGQLSAPSGEIGRSKIYGKRVVASGSDPADMLLHFNSNSSSAPIDESEVPLTSAYVGNAGLSTVSGASPSHFPEDSSCYFNGSSSPYDAVDIIYPISMVWDEDFTIDLWFKRESGGGSGRQYLFSVSDSSILYESNSSSLQMYLDGGNVKTTITNEAGNSWGDGPSISGVQDDTWHHVAIRKYYNNVDTKWYLQLFLDGSAGTPFNDSNQSNFVESTFGWGGIMRLGIHEDNGNSWSDPFKGWIDEFRIVQGQGLSFTSSPPPGPYDILIYDVEVSAVNSAGVETQLTVDPNLLFLDGSTDKIGIGTITPRDKLEILGGNLRITNDLGEGGANTGKPSIVFSEDVSQALAHARVTYNGDPAGSANYLALACGDGSGGDFAADTDGTLFVVDTDRVGIKTSIPDSVLQADVTGDKARFTLNSGNHIDLLRGANDYQALIEAYHHLYLNSEGTGASGVMSFQLGGSDRMRLTEVGGQACLIIGDTYDTPPANAKLLLKAAGDVGLQIEADDDNSGENDNPMIRLTQDNATNEFDLGMIGDAGQIFTNSLANHGYVEATQGFQVSTNGAARVTVDGTYGRVGIGSSATAPQCELEVAGQVLGRAGRGSTSPNKIPLAYRSNGTEVFSIDPSMDNAQLAAFFDWSAAVVTWDETQDDAPGGYAIKVVGKCDVGGYYGAGFPFIPIEDQAGQTSGDATATYYGEIWIKNSDSDTDHFVGNSDHDADYTVPATGKGNPGTYGYFITAGATDGTTWTKYSGYLTGYHDTASHTFETGASYFSPFALLNYNKAYQSAGETDHCWISGWKIWKVSSIGDQTVTGTIKGDAISGGSGVGADDGYGFDDYGNHFVGLQYDTGSGGTLNLNSYGDTIVHLDTNDNDPNKFVVRARPLPDASGSTLDVLTMKETGQLTVRSDGGAKIAIKGTHALLEFYEDGSGTGRSGFVGYDTDGQNHLIINNENNSDVLIGTNDTLRLTVHTDDNITTSSGASLTGGNWTNASSREYKQDITPLSDADATAAIMALEPQNYTHKKQGTQHVGFIAEDVPDLLATEDRKGLSSMDIVAALTKVVQRQEEQINRLMEIINNK